MAEALSGIRVLELASVLAGPLASTALAVRGATVTKVERPPGGDVTRTWKSLSEPRAHPASAYYASANANKSVAWQDLGTPEGRQWLDQQLAIHDVVIQNFKAADLAKFELDPAAVALRHPELVHVRLVGFPEAAERLAYDVVVQAETGFMSMNGEPGGLPLRMPVAMMDVLASHQIRAAVLEGLLGKARGLGGCYAEVSLEASGIAALVNQATNWLMNGELPEAMGSLHPNIAPYGDLLQCADGWMVLAVGNDRQFASLCQALGMGECATLPEFCTNGLRLENRDVLMEKLNAHSRSQSRQALDATFTELGVPAGVVRTVDEVFASGTAGNSMLIRDEWGVRPSPVAYTVQRW
jgi:crotonobetainyl-CoA:carnitine CoA-transferase CaiB-like acyl-CoA transferase